MAADTGELSVRGRRPVAGKRKTRIQGDLRLQVSTTLGEAIDAQRDAVPRFTQGQRKAGWRTLALVAAVLWTHWACAAGTGATVSGVVRDVSGAVQMGALVQVLAGDSSTVGTAFTDARGRYAIENLNAGRYLVRASQSLYVPVTRTDVQLRMGAKAVVNLTMAALFDTAAWLPATRRSADEPADDWRWTLRSSANRPILRVVDGGLGIEVSAEGSGRTGATTEARAWVGERTGWFGEGGTHSVLAIHHSLAGDHGDGMIWADAASSPYGLSQRLETAFEDRAGVDGAARTVLSYQSHPELAETGEAGGMQVLAITSARRMNLADALTVEVGGRMEAVHTSESGIVAQPFVRVTAHPKGVWTLRYRMASDRQVQGFDQVAAGESDVPVALVRNGKLALESGRHQEVALGRQIGRGTVELAYYHDALQNVAVAGVLSTQPSPSLALAAGPSATPEGWVADRTSGALRTLANGYQTSGARVTWSTPVASGMWVAAEYSTGDALSPEAPASKLGRTPAEMLRPRSGQAASVALKGQVLETGTRIHAAYRWQTDGTVSAVNPYGQFSGESFLGCGVRQSLLRSHGATGLDATIDVTNLLAQGYRPYLSADGQTVYFAQTPRTVQAGLSFTF